MNNGIPTMGEVIARSKVNGAKAITVVVAVVFLMVGVVYTGIHNFNLYGRALPVDQKLFALIPVIMLEGGIVLFTAAGFVWFSGGAQKLVATAAGWGLFGVVAANTVIDSLVVAGSTLPDWLQLYATFGLYAMPVAVMAIIKLLLDLDPAKRKLDLDKAIEHALIEAKFAAAQRALGADENRLALQDYGDAFAQQLAKTIRSSAPAMELIERPPMQLAKDADAAQLAPAKPDAAAQEARPNV